MEYLQKIFLWRQRFCCAICSRSKRDRLMRDVITFAIGDVHGCSQKLESLVAVCEAICVGRAARFVLIGDYVDRGPDPKGVIDFLIKRQLRDPDHFVCLRGNHEQMLIAAAVAERSDSDLINWWANGG